MSKPSRDRVKFFLPSRYFVRNRSRNSNGMDRRDCQDVLHQAFNIGDDRSRDLFEREPEGFWIVCRPSQFARFIVLRAQVIARAGGVNGISDLQTSLFVPDERPPRERLAALAGIEPGEAGRVLHHLGLGPKDVERLLKQRGIDECPTWNRGRTVVDVSTHVNVHRADEEML